MPPIPITNKESLLMEINRNIRKYDSRKDVSRGSAIGVKIATVLLGAGVTILLGWKFNGKPVEWMTNLALTFGASIAALNTIDTFFSFSGRWRMYKDICTQLFTLKNVIIDDTFEDDGDLDRYKASLNEIIAEARKKELEMHKKGN